ncbi:hypothetical protein [Streptomyces hoynatensis]|uniref:Orn/Lys/Arg decarboxylase C-terminal domain-containing protein n=1 Tax=Streptomyces hoynatensis TaxID=1141874 RepID=A0A3A9Z9G4_9ACTN|nr:hypothetical protein D7294_07790 [Streptomyces hoynatensis]
MGSPKIGGAAGFHRCNRRRTGTSTGFARAPPRRAAVTVARSAAAVITVTPPGIPVLMPGEHAGGPGGPLLRYLSALEERDRRFPGFGSETHGVRVAPDMGDHLIECLRPAPGEKTA